MKKYCVFFLLFAFPYSLFSQGVGILSVGTTLESSKTIDYHKPMLTFELDMFGIAPSNGFTFFWNNSFSWAKKDLQFISSEILLGATFRRDKALNISFGLGPRMASSVNFGGLDDPVHIISTLLGLGGTFGLSYYFNDSFGISLFASDFVCLDTGTMRESRRIHNGGEVIETKPSYKISNTFSVRAGVNFRIFGSLRSGYRSSGYSGGYSDDREDYSVGSNSSHDSNSTNGRTANTYRLPTPQEILDELNLVRTNPKGYVKYLKQRLASFVEDFVYIDCVGRRIISHEGVDAVYECIEVLENTLPMGTLSMNENLCSSSIWLAKDQAYHGTTGHDGSDGSTMTDRVKRSGFTGRGWGENCAYGQYTARDFIMALLVDDDVPSRGHRKNILNSKYTQVGVGLATGHGTYNTVLVTDFGY